MNILNRLSESGEFRPQSVEQYLAFQIARKLDDEHNLHKYLRWAEEFDLMTLVRAFRRLPERGARQRRSRRCF